MLTEKNARRFVKARRAVIEQEYAHLNPEQRKAVMATEGPLLLLAGAGSGKTTVLINRVANLLKYGRGADSDEVPERVTEEDVAFLEEYAKNPSEDALARATWLCALEPLAPWNILAITFTNKAAGELKERLEQMLGPEALDIWAATFHSICVRILRRDIDRIGYSKNFTIYDTDDSLRVIKDILAVMNLDDKMYPPRGVLSQISRQKDQMNGPEECLEQSRKSNDFRMEKIAQIYIEYQNRLRAADALDFDDIIFKTVILLQQFEEVRLYYQKKFRYVLIDEYQDTNHAQYLLSALLAGGYENICVVGDDDQSIYKFRGATIENILSFEEQYKGARVIRLEQNYRSTSTILDAANGVISHNKGRKGKRLWTDHKAGDPIVLYTASDEHDEAQYVASQLLADYARNKTWKGCAILYRTNAQSNQLEYALKRNGIPYRIFGGTRFFDRAEVKDMTSYLCVVNNPRDDLRLLRIINRPARGIGDKTIELAQQVASRERLPLWEVMKAPGQYNELRKAAPRLNQFVGLIAELQALSETLPLPDFYEELMTRTGYLSMLEEKNTVENRSRAENVRELKSSINTFVEHNEDATLSGFLDEIALYTDLDSEDAGEDCVVLMTMHSAKGLEFPHVYLTGVEEGVFPGTRSIGDPMEMEEERRLCYVAITRAKEHLTITCAKRRMLYGQTKNNRVSRFVDEIPDACLLRTGAQAYEENLKDALPSFETLPQFQNEQKMPLGYLKKPAAMGQTNHFTSSFGRSSSSKGRTAIPFRQGDLVEHRAFGTGMILSVQPMGGDALLEIAFDNVGTKRLMAKAAMQQMKKVSK